MTEKRATGLFGYLGPYGLTLAAMGLVSGLVNVLYLTGSIFMLEVYDRVIPSRSVPTLVGLALITAVLFCFQGILEVIRSRVMVRLGSALDEALEGRVFDVIIRRRLADPGGPDTVGPMRDLDSVRSFLSSSGPGALFDLPWMPLYLAICFAFHVVIGLAALVGAIVLVSLTILTDMLTGGPSRLAGAAGNERLGGVQSAARFAEVMHALGMTGRMRARWAAVSLRYRTHHQRMSDVSGSLGAMSKVLRMALQSAVLGIGAYLVIHEEASGGIIIASSILTARALAPVDLAIANWKGFVAARQGWGRLRQVLGQDERAAQPLALPAPKRQLSVENVSVAIALPGGAGRIVVRDVSFQLKAGQVLGIIGPSGSGKSTLVRSIVGSGGLARGVVRLDGAALEQWDSDELGRHIGYLPQDVQLFEGTIAENIARFERDPPADAVIAAASAAGVHDLVLRLPNGYDTRLGEAGSGLSAGQKQRVALARALYRDPFLLVLDEPNSNLDSEGEAALVQAVAACRDRGAIVLLVSHRPSALANADSVLVIVEGKVQAFGPKADILRPTAAGATRIRPAAAKEAS